MHIADEARLIPIPDLREWYPKLGFSGRGELATAGEPIFVTDPIYLADIYNPNDDPNATFLRQKAVVVSDFGGDTAAPVWWKPPFLIVPTSQHDQPEMPAGATRLAEQIGCDSASFVFIALNDDVPPALRKKIDEVEGEKNGARLKLPRARTASTLSSSRRSKSTSSGRTGIGTSSSGGRALRPNKRYRLEFTLRRARRACGRPRRPPPRRRRGRGQ